jgi:hypothetical protein
MVGVEVDIMVVEDGEEVDMVEVGEEEEDTVEVGEVVDME